MKNSYARSSWNGTLKNGMGVSNFNKYELPYDFGSRFEDGKKTTPEELIGTAHSACYSMYLSALLSNEKNIGSIEIKTEAKVTLDTDDIGPVINKILLTCELDVEGISHERLTELAKEAKIKCPVSRLYNNGTAEIKLEIKNKKNDK